MIFYSFLLCISIFCVVFSTQKNTNSPQDFLKQTNHHFIAFNADFLDNNFVGVNINNRLFFEKIIINKIDNDK
jgi:hypothetical protein